MRKCIVCDKPISHRTLSPYCDKLCKFHGAPFRSWDGEGISPKPGIHNFTLLAYRDFKTNSYQWNDNGISTMSAFDFLSEPREKAINIWYAFDYDVNCILKDIPLYPYLEELAKTSETNWHGWKVRYVPGKIFSIWRDRFFVSYDVFGFFQKSFLKTCKSFDLDVNKIELGKADRANFLNWKKEDIIEYNDEELKLLLQVMTQFRQSLRYHAPKRNWYGPGAVAHQWLVNTVKLDSKKHRNWLPEMQDAIMRAYFGGRIDVSAIGEINPCYSYDIKSCYPAAMTHIPNVKEWHYSKNAKENHYFGLYRVKWDVDDEEKCQTWGPFPWRSHESSILFPTIGEGWYYGAELFAAERAFRKKIRRLEAYLPITLPGFPLKLYIEDAFEQRRNLEAKGDPAEIAYKLIPNSLYGKFAQKQLRKDKVPLFQNYLWAGFTTAFARAMLLEQIAKYSDDIVAVATDSIFARKPILPMQKDGILGHWQYEGCGPTLIIMPGLYAKMYAESEEVEKFKRRGFPSNFNYGSVLREWGCDTQFNTPGEPKAVMTINRFVTFRHAIAQKHKEWGFFRKEEKELQNVSVWGFGKRFPDPEMIWEEHWKERLMLPTPTPPSEEISHPYRIATFEEEVERELITG